ncbi:MAG: nickel pincer cofactor biosynthesis protein LarC [Planctomycetes bacterium]|nr:nickel pincer cofactor biosynthesis protein LarC [Planctomycetota bacterium]
MKIAYFDCFSGASGDMILGALLHAGFPFSKLEAELKKLKIDGYELVRKKVLRSGIAGTKFDVFVQPVKTETCGHQKQTLKSITRIVDDSDLHKCVKEDSVRVFSNIAEAEARVHGTTPDDVHFHEVGAVDSIVDIVGAAIAIHTLNIEKIYFSTMRTGTGVVSCDHGNFPIPAPATIELLKGCNVTGTDIEFELTTPTGAAILTTLGENVKMCPEIALSEIGYGVGSREIPQIPNMLRVMVGETASLYEADEVWVVETNIDDMSGEHLGNLLEEILNAGALDGYITPVQMKKSRPGSLISVIVEDKNVMRVEDIIFYQSTTFGIRKYKTSRRKLSRQLVSVHTEFGMIQVKIGMFNGKIRNVSPEHEDCKRVAVERGLPLKLVYQVTLEAARQSMINSIA